MAKRFWNYILNASEWISYLHPKAIRPPLSNAYGHKEVRP